MGTFQKAFEEYGADYTMTMSRFMGNEAMYLKFLNRLFEDESLQKLGAALEAADWPGAFEAAHTLKGVCQNLGFSNLYAPTYTLTETLRAGQLEGTQEQFAKVAEQYKRTVDAIRALD